MSENTPDDADLLGFEDELRASALGGAPASPGGRVFDRVRGHVQANPGGRGRFGGWNRRLFAIAAIAIPAGAAAAITAAVLVSQPQKAVLPLPAGSPSSEPSISPSLSPSEVPAPAERLVVVLRDSTGTGNPVGLGVAADTILLVGPDGKVRNQAKFKRPVRPVFTNAATILPPQVRTAAGSAYHVDGDGIVWRLGASGADERVADFSVTSVQHETSFAVSPDGQTLVASVLTFGKVRTCTSICAPFTEGPSYAYLLRADAGGPTSTMSKIQIDPSQVGAQTPLVLGWDSGGPIAGLDAPLATQNAGPTGWNAHAGHLNQAGKITDALGGADCLVRQETFTGIVLCNVTGFEATDIVVRSGTGETIWTLPPKLEPTEAMATSSEGASVALFGFAQQPTNPNAIYRNRGTALKLSGDFAPLDWLDASTLIGYTGDPNSPVLSTAGVDRPGTNVRFPIQGSYGGVVNP